MRFPSALNKSAESDELREHEIIVQELADSIDDMDEGDFE